MKILENNFNNNIDTTLISPRRMGKTGLIYRFFGLLDNKNGDFITIYADIFSSRSLEGFIKLLAEAILHYYPEKNTEALLRTYIQQLSNMCFIFSGSKTTLMLDIFSNSKRPFFSMTQYLSLKKIDRKTYCDFIVRKFEENKRTIDDTLIEKDLLLSESTVDSVYYQVYDVFFMRWLQEIYSFNFRNPSPESHS